MPLIKSGLDYLRHRWRARRWDSFHSPFLFKLFSYACDDTIRFPLFESIERCRHDLLNSSAYIRRSEFGAGSRMHENQVSQSVAGIARTALSLPFQCRFMARLANFTSPEVVVEFGTSLGIATAYLSAGIPTAQIITIEGDPVVAEYASINFQSLGINNISVVKETFETFLTGRLQELKSIDLIFIDGNHRKASLLQYYAALKKFISPQTIIIVDDIYWSEEMNEGWNELTNYPEVTQSVDCFQFGLLFFNPGFISKEHHLIKLPWRSLGKK